MIDVIQGEVALEIEFAWDEHLFITIMSNGRGDWYDPSTQTLCK